MWPGLGFESVREFPGRSAAGHLLVEWWLDHGHPSLFDLLEEPGPGKTADVSLRAVVDTNVFLDWRLEPPAGDSDSRALLEPWVGAVADVTWLVTPELESDLQRRSEDAEGDNVSAELGGLSVVKSDGIEFAEAWATARNILFGIEHDVASMSPKALSDSRHIAHVVAAGESNFVTRDDELLAKADDLAEALRIEVMRPVDLLVRIHQIAFQDQYRPVALRSTEVSTTRLVPKTAETIATDLANRSEGQGKRAVLASLRSLLSRPEEVVTRVVTVGGAPTIVYAETTSKAPYTHIPFFRMMPRRGAETVGRNVVWHMMECAMRRSCAAVVCADEAMDEGARQAFADMGFQKHGATLLRLLVAACGQPRDLHERLRTMVSQLLTSKDPVPGEPASMVETYIKAVEELRRKPNTILAMRLEEALWPLIVLGMNVPTFLVPIQPRWARELFDYELAGQELLPASADLMLNAENIYYCTGRKFSDLVEGARIIWYVSKGQTHDGVGAARAISTVREVMLGPAKEVYRRGRRLGVYKWSHIAKMVEGDVSKRVLAIRFSHTRLLREPVRYADLRRVYAAATSKTLSVRAPLRLPEDVLVEVLKLGGNYSGSGAHLDQA
jgi:hypothetical protein